jgi:choline kinase
MKVVSHARRLGRQKCRIEPCHQVRSKSVNEPDAVRQTIILAAGNGSRLGSHAAGLPKPLVTVAGEPLVARALGHAQASGCREAVVVLGHASALVRASVEALSLELQVQFVENPDPTSQNGVSLLAAEPLAARRFFLQMVDHVFARPILSRLTVQPLAGDEDGRVLVDRAPGGLDLDDATKVSLMGDRVAAIGKGLARWDAVDAGCFVLTSAVFDALRRVPEARARTVSAGMRQLAGRGSLGAADLGSVAWVDVDTPLDHAAAERLLVSHPWP